jgi:Zn-dependent protease with chaperone function
MGAMKIRLLFAVLLCALALPAAAQQAFTNRSTELKGDGADAKVLATLPENTEVKVIQRAGGYTKVEAKGQVGWVRVFHLRFPAVAVTSESSGGALSGLSSIIGGRPKSQQAGIQTVGVRGLSPEDLKNASPDPAALAKAKTYSSDKPTAENLRAMGSSTPWPSTTHRERDRMKTTTIFVALALCAGTAQAIDFGGLINKGLDAGKKLQEANKDYTQEEEIQIGEAATAGFLGASPLHADANLQRYVNRVGKWLALHSERPDLPWTFSVIDTETINAFALPGGSVLISSGLLKRLANESELAGVLAHEVAHVVKRHQITAIQSAAKGSAYKSIGTDIASDRIRGGGVAGQALKPFALNLVGDLMKDGFFLRPLDRGLEYEADRMAVVIATRAGYDPYGLAAAMQMLAQFKSDGDAASVMSTHPAPAERLAELEKIMPNIEARAKQPQLLEARFRQNVK